MGDGWKWPRIVFSGAENLGPNALLSVDLTLLCYISTELRDM